ELFSWLAKLTDQASPQQIAIAAETPRGSILESALERGHPAFSINPKQLDRFRDRFSMAGAKDDHRDAFVLASSLRTDQHCFRRFSASELKALLEQPPLPMAPGAAEALAEPVLLLLPHLELLHKQLAQLSARIDKLIDQSDTTREAGGLMSWAASKAVRL